MENMKKELDSVGEELKVVKKENQQLKERIVKLEKNEKQVRSDLEEKVKASVKVHCESETYVDKLKKNLNVEPGQVVQCVAQMQDRKQNLIFRGIKELADDNPEKRKEHDQREVEKVANFAGLPDMFKQSVITTRRLGKKEEGKDYRPLLVRLASQDLREEALRSNRNLREHNKKNKDSQSETETRYRIDPDMTKEQMAALNKLWDEARDKSKNGKRYFVIGKENPVLRWREEEG